MMYSVCRLYWIYGYTAKTTDMQTERRQIEDRQLSHSERFTVCIFVCACVYICILAIPEVLLGFLVLPVAVSPACLVLSRQRCYVHH